MYTPVSRNEMNPELLHSCSICPCRTIDEYFLFCFFVAENLGSPKTQTSQKKAKNASSIEKKKKQSKTTVTGSAGAHIKHMCHNSGFISQKRRGHWTLKGFGAVCLNEHLHDHRAYFAVGPVCMS